MKRMLFTIPDGIAKNLQELVPEGERSKFIVQNIQMPLEVLKTYKKKKPKKSSPYKTSFIRGMKQAEAQAKKGEIYSHEEIMKEFGLL